MHTLYNRSEHSAQVTHLLFFVYLELDCWYYIMMKLLVGQQFHDKWQFDKIPIVDCDKPNCLGKWFIRPAFSWDLSKNIREGFSYLKIQIGFSIRIWKILFIRIRQLNFAKIIKKMTYNKENLAKFLFNQFWFTESITILDQHLPGIWAKECG